MKFEEFYSAFPVRDTPFCGVFDTSDAAAKTKETTTSNLITKLNNCIAPGFVTLQGLISDTWIKETSGYLLGKQSTLVDGNLI